MHFYTQLRNRLRRIRSGVDFNAQIVEFLRQCHHFKVVVLAHADQRADFSVTRKLQIEACGGKPLEQGFRHGPTDTQHLAGRFHLRSQNGVDIGKLFKGEHGHLYCKVGRRLIQTCAVAQICQGRAGHYPAGDIHQRHAGDLADIGNSTGRTGFTSITYSSP